MKELLKAKQKVLALKADIEKKSALYDTYRSMCSKESLLLEALKQEEHDVEVLHGFTFTSILETIKRTKAEREQRELEALQIAKERYERFIDEKSALLETIEALEQSCECEPHIHQEYNQVFFATLEYYKTLNTPESYKVIAYEQQLQKAESDYKKLTESQALNKKIQNHLFDILSTLDDATTYSTLEITGGDIWASTLKKERIQAAIEKIHEIHCHVNLYETQLRGLELIDRHVCTTLITISTSVEACMHQLENCNLLRSQILKIQEEMKCHTYTYDKIYMTLDTIKKQNGQWMQDVKEELETYILHLEMSDIA